MSQPGEPGEPGRGWQDYGTKQGEDSKGTEGSKAE